jgi:hypothetical protein
MFVQICENLPIELNFNLKSISQSQNSFSKIIIQVQTASGQRPQLNVELSADYSVGQGTPAARRDLCCPAAHFVTKFC